MNLLGRGKRKFVFQFHIDKKTRPVALSDTEKRTIRKTITSKLRQAVKPGRNRIDPAGEAVSFPCS